DIRPHTDSALAIINSATIYDYRLRSEVSQGKDRVRIGLVIGEGYKTPSCVVDGDGVEQYMMNSLSWFAIQELDKSYKALE
nr:tail fiber domain-containing protein [Vibrio cholerae]